MTPLELHTDVIYHGSVTAHHGTPMTIVEVSQYDTANLSQDGHRYVLKYGPNSHQFLWNVRRQSFSPVSEETN